MFFQVGRAAIFSTEAQTAADAAALGAVDEVKAQLLQQVATTGTSNLALIDPIRVRAAAERYARRNKGHVIKLERRGVDVKVWTSTNAKLGSGADNIDSREHPRHGAGPLADRRDRDSGAGGLGGATSARSAAAEGRSSGSSPPTEWEDLERGHLRARPTCGSSARSNDLVKLGEAAREHGFTVGENAEMGDNPRADVHAEGGFHYKCRNSGALDVNADNAARGPRSRSSTASSPTSRSSASARSGRRPGTIDHIHIDIANSGAIGVGGGDERRGRRARGDAGCEVKLIDWEASYTPFAGFGGLGSGGFYGGPPTRGGQGHLQRARRDQRLAEGPARHLRDRDRRVGRPQPQLRRPRLGRRLPAARRARAGASATRSWIPSRRGARVHPPRQDQQRANPGTAPASSRSRSRSPASRCATTRSRRRRSRCTDKYCGGGAVRRLSCCWPRVSRSPAAACSTTRARRPTQPLDPAVYGPPRRLRREHAGVRRIPKLAAAERRGGARRWTTGEIGVVDLGGVVSIEPETLETACDVTLEDAALDALGRGRAPRASGRSAMLTCQPTCAGRRHDRGRRQRSRCRASRRATGAATSSAARSSIDPKDSPSAGAAARDLPARALLRRARGRSARAGAVAAQRARGARDQLAAPAAGPGVDGLQQLVGQRRPDRPGRRPPRRACRSPSTPRRPGSARPGRAAGCRAAR